MVLLCNTVANDVRGFRWTAAKACVRVACLLLPVCFAIGSPTVAPLGASAHVSLTALSMPLRSRLVIEMFLS